MGCCESLFGFTKLAETELPASPGAARKRNNVMRLCSGLDGKWHGRHVALKGGGGGGNGGEFLNIATGRGISLGEAAMEQDRVYFEVVFDYFPTTTREKKGAKKTARQRDEAEDADAAADDVDAGGVLPVVDPVAKENAKLFAVGVAVKTSIKKRKQLSDGQISDVPKDHKDRWLWTWGPDLAMLDCQKKGRHVLGCAFDQSTGSGNIVVTLDGKFAAGPLPEGLRGIKGTCFPAIELLPPVDGSYAVRATANFSVDETAFEFSIPDGFSGLVPARGVL